MTAGTDADGELQRLRRRLELAEAELARYASSVSHELRTPLAAIVGFLELLRVREGDALGDDAREFLRRAETGAHQLDVMLEGLTQLARVELEPGSEVLSWSDVVAGAIGAMPEDIAATVDAITIADPLPHVVGDRGALERLVGAVLDNALRHHPTPEEARIVVRASEGGGLVIEDDGDGIDDANLERALQPFKAGATAGPGRGIGLPIALRIAQAHGGTLALSRSPLGGLRVSVRLGG